MSSKIFNHCNMNHGCHMAGLSGKTWSPVCVNALLIAMLGAESERVTTWHGCRPCITVQM